MCGGSRCKACCSCYIYVYVYIYIERERPGALVGGPGVRHVVVVIYMCMYI
jgi:hypothetical protein